MTPSSPSPARKATVWIVDDSPLQLKRATEALQDRYALEGFPDGEAALERMAQGTAPDVMLLDWQLPGVSGLEVCRFIRQRHDEVSLPILVQTASRSREDYGDALRAGANDYLAKPYPDEELLARIGTLVRVRQQAELLRARADFEEKLIGIVSHDLRSPLNAIVLGARTLVLRDELGDQSLRTISKIQSSAERASRLIRDLLDFTQARLGGGIAIRRGPMDLYELVRQVREELAVVHPERTIELLLESAGAGHWDSDRIAQVIQNLLANALAYGRPGSAIQLRATGTAGEVTLSVHNQGAPIAPEMLPRIFEPMQRADALAGRESRSIGLGLYIVQQIVQAHGGSVEVASTAAEGTTFTVKLARTA